VQGLHQDDRSSQITLLLGNSEDPVRHNSQGL
jgi:hypothetical protein